MVLNDIVQGHGYKIWCNMVVEYILLVLRLYGYKWFSSATDSNMSLTLARLEGCQEDFVKFQAYSARFLA